MLIQLESRNAKTYTKQIIEKISGLIDNASLLPGTKLPSSRELAQNLGISRFTVYQAYSELQAFGYLESKPGSYNTVCGRKAEASIPATQSSCINWEKLSNPQAEQIFSVYKKHRGNSKIDPNHADSVIDLSQLIPDSRLLPIQDFKRSFSAIIAEMGADVFQYAEHQGFRPLRETIARHLRLHGIKVTHEEILITQGSQQAIDLLLRLLSDKNKSIVIEDPSYSLLLPLAQLHNLRILSVPLLSDGMDLDVLEKYLKRKDIACVYTMPNFQNPTGITTSHSHREQLIRLCTQYKTPIIEDGFEEDLKYYGKVDLAVKSMDDQNIVLYVGTFSKVLFPGIRMGWIAADKECIRRLTAVKRFSEISSSYLLQSVLYRFCKNGYYEKHLKRIHRIFRKRMETVLQSLKQWMPPEVVWTKPIGGFTLWVTLPAALDQTGFDDAFGPFKVAVSPGMQFSPGCLRSSSFRICIAALNEEEIAQGIQRLGNAVRELLKTQNKSVKTRSRYAARIKK